MNEIDKLKYEEAYTMLEEVIYQLESGNLSLEKSVEVYEQGRLLTAHCQKLLENAELKINQVNETGRIN